MNSEELSAICHAAADLVARGWSNKADACNARREAVSPLSEAAVAWSMHGALVKAATEATDDEDEAERVANRLSRLASIPCSRRCGTEREPFLTVSHFEDRQGVFPGDCEQILRDTADLAAAGVEIPPPPFEFGWWQRLGGGDEE